MQQIPYTWLNPVLAGTSAVLLFTAVTLLIVALLPTRYSKAKVLFTALASFLLAIAFGAANYALIFFVQLPAFAESTKQAHQESIASRNAKTTFVVEGQQVPPFQIKTTDGTEVTIESLRGKVVLLNFFATWCGPCLAELPHVQEIWDANKSRDDFALFVIGREETNESVAAFRKDKGYSFPMAADSNRGVYSLFAENSIPRTYVIARDGTIRYASIGYTEEGFQELTRALEKELQAIP